MRRLPVGGGDAGRPKSGAAIAARIRRSVERAEEGRVWPRLTVSPIDVSTCPQPPESVRGFFVPRDSWKGGGHGPVRDRIGWRRGVGLARQLCGSCARVLRRTGVRAQPHLALPLFSRAFPAARRPP